MKKLQLKGIKEMLTKGQMKKITGGYDGGYGGGGGGGVCNYRCCSSEHTNCSDYVASSKSCSSSSDCSAGNSYCSQGHMYWKCF